VDRWEKKYPGSITAQIVHARMLVNYAWEARGAGWADTVTDEGWGVFFERLNEARAMLDKNPKAKSCPGYYSTMMTVALGQSWPRDDFDRLFAEAVSLAPDDEVLYFRKSYFLQPKWYGQPGEWLKFAAEAAASTSSQLGMELYTRIVWSTIGTGNIRALQQNGVDWPKMRQGFEDMARRYPGSLWNKNAYCYYAYAAHDRDTVRRLMVELQGQYEPAIWRSEGLFETAMAWADNPS